MFSAFVSEWSFNQLFGKAMPSSSHMLLPVYTINIICPRWTNIYVYYKHIYIYIYMSILKAINSVILYLHT